MSRTLAGLRSRGRINPVDLESTLGEIRTALLEADVALIVVDQLISEVRRRGLEALSLKQSGINPAQQVITIIHEEILKVLGTNARSLATAKRPPSKIMLAGLQGSGKTTLAGKLALWLKEQGNTPLLVACDLARPNAVQQLQIIGEQIGVPVFAPESGNGIGDPIKVAAEGLAFAEKRLHNYVIFDTAGRLGIDVELMKQARAIKSAITPDDTLFVVDAMTGQDAVNTAHAFNTAVGIDGVVLTKVDSDARAGAALSVTSVIGKPILFLSTGEKSQDFEPFYPERMAQRILGMGDVATLAEQAKKALDEKSAARATRFGGSGSCWQDKHPWERALSPVLITLEAVARFLITYKNLESLWLQKFVWLVWERFVPHTFASSWLIRALRVTARRSRRSVVTHQLKSHH